VIEIIKNQVEPVCSRYSSVEPNLTLLLCHVTAVITVTHSPVI